ncbi:MAG: YihY/virulence factor BrkB family protein [Anaerolineae bacterium]|nr:YihY/virulence factor BrkB family protein [Anaerolineae bacterium]
MRKLRRLIQNLTRRFQRQVKQADRFSGGILSILIYSIKSFNDSRAFQAAASIAYYALFSLFPFLLLLIYFGTSILNNQETLVWVLNYTTTLLPTARNLVEENIEEVLASRGTAGLVAIIGLLWAATSVFDILAININLAWREAEERNILQRRLMGLIVITLFAVLLILSFLSTTIFGLLPWLDVNGTLWGDTPLYDTLFWQISSALIPWLFVFIMFWGLYRWVPNIHVRWSEAIWGALLAASLWEILKFGFTWYLSSGLARYRLVYGSLGTVIVLMLWIYLSSVVILFGAHLSGAITAYNNRGYRRRK